MSNEEKFDRDRVKARLKEAQLNVRSDHLEEEYKFDNEDLELKKGNAKKLADLEEKYKGKPKIQFHKLTREGERLF